jgi:hypothetical protein
MLFYLIFTPLFVITFNQAEKLIDYISSGNNYLNEDTVTAFNTEKDILTKKYRIVNLAKSVLLGSLSIHTLFLLIDVIFFPKDVSYNTVEIFAGLYTSMDMAALIYNTKNHPSTNIHHITVQFLYFYIVYFDFAMINLVRPIVTYACYSVFAYLVNGRLSIRNLGLKYEREVNDLSLIVYVNTSILNWITQFYLIFFATPELPFFYTKMIYLFLVLVIVSDDIFLMKYLYNYRIKHD